MLDFAAFHQRSLCKSCGVLKMTTSRCVLQFESVKNGLNFGTNIIWRHPPADVICKIKPKSRRQFYARKIVGVLEKTGPALPSRGCLKGIEFTQLCDVTLFGGEWSWVRRWLHPYFQPALQGLSLHGCEPPTDESLAFISSRCPNLRQLRLWDTPLGVEVQRFIEFLQSLKFFISLAIFTHGVLREESILISDTDIVQIFTYLACRRSIKELNMGTSTIMTHENLLEAFRQDSSQPLFENLVILRLRMESKSVAQLLPAATSLEFLTLTVVGFEHDMFQTIGSFTKLYWLTLEFSYSFELYPSDLDALVGLDRLSYLDISVETDNKVEALWLTDDYFRQWISHFRQLGTLQLLGNIVTNLTYKSLESIGYACPLLEHCALPGKFYLQDMQLLPRPLFPNLIILELNEILEFTEARLAEIDDQLIGTLWASRPENVRIATELLFALAPNLDRFGRDEDERLPRGGPFVRRGFVEDLEEAVQDAIIRDNVMLEHFFETLH